MALTQNCLRLLSTILVMLLAVTCAAPAQTAARPPITGIAFMRLYTSDTTAADKFYGSTLGLPRHASGDKALFPINSSQWIEVSHSGAPPTPNTRLLAVGFRTTDLAGLKQYLAEHGVETQATAQAGELAVRDPEGNLVIFVQAGDSGSEAHLASTSTPLPSATSDRLIHVGYIVRDQGKEDAFWQGILGFRPYWHGGANPDRVDWVSLQVPNGTDWLEYMLNAPAAPDLRNAGGSNHFSLGVDRMQTVLTGLERNGCEEKMCRAIQTGRDGKIQLNVFDPDGTRVEFMEFRPVLKPCCSAVTGTHPSENDPVK